MIGAVLKFLSRLTVDKVNWIGITLPLPSLSQNKITMGNYRYFTDDEIKGLDHELVAMLDMARHKAGVPFIITSGVRSAIHNVEVGGVHDSAHETGKAVDLACEDSRTRFLMLKALFEVGFKRLGLYPRHIHVDIAFDKDQDVTWLGEYKNG